jgi:hypothetical protein
MSIDGFSPEQKEAFAGYKPDCAFIAWPFARPRQDPGLDLAQVY